MEVVKKPENASSPIVCYCMSFYIQIYERMLFETIQNTTYAREACHNHFCRDSPQNE